MTSGVNAVPLAFAVSVIELTVAPTLAESCTSIVMATENANDDPESPGHCGLQRVAVIGLGRTPTLKLAWLDFPSWLDGRGRAVAAGHRRGKHDRRYTPAKKFRHIAPRADVRSGCQPPSCEFLIMRRAEESSGRPDGSRF
jgi:hypothetical protein